MTVVKRFNTTAAMFTALSAGFILLAATDGVHAGGHGHPGKATISAHVANSPPIIATPGKDHHRGHHRNRGVGFGFAQAYWLVDSPCEVRRVHIDRDTDMVIIRRAKSCADGRAQVVTFPGY
jgi:hypothetical protein